MVLFGFNSNEQAGSVVVDGDEVGVRWECEMTTTSTCSAKIQLHATQKVKVYRGLEPWTLHLLS